MQSRRIALSVVGVALALGLSGCTKQGDKHAGRQAPGDTGSVSVYVTNYPLRYFAERIGGEHVEVHFPAPPEKDPAYWMPDSETISKYQQADLILLNGAGYEKWVDTVSLPKRKLCDTSAAFAEKYVALEGTVTHSHGPEGKHVHGATAFTTWLDPTFAVSQADAIRASLAKLRPELASTLLRNFAALKTDLVNLDQEFADTVANSPDHLVLFSHPVYQYFEHRYGLDAKSVHWEPDEPPTDAMWAELKKLLEEHPAKWMVWEGEPLAPVAEKLAERGLACIVFDPCGNTPCEGDYLTTQRKNLAALAEVYSDST